jgi:hypothetical protein
MLSVIQKESYRINMSKVWTEKRWEAILQAVVTLAIWIEE